MFASLCWSGKSLKNLGCCEGLFHTAAVFGSDVRSCESLGFSPQPPKGQKPSAVLLLDDVGTIGCQSSPDASHSVPRSLLPPPAAALPGHFNTPLQVSLL